MIKKYVKKPIVIEAIQYDGTNKKQIEEFIEAKIKTLTTNGEKFIKTLEGYRMVEVGNYIIKGIHGEFYPCKPDIFQKTYEEVTE